jgi:hypothetical protein
MLSSLANYALPAVFPFASLRSFVTGLP